MRLPSLKLLYEEATRYSKEKGEHFDELDRIEKIYDDYVSRKDPFLFAQYSDINKLGINPQSHYETPLGIYSYPVGKNIGQIDLMDISTGHVPFAGERKYITLFTVKDSFKDKMVILNMAGNLDSDSPINREEYFEEQIEKKIPPDQRKCDKEFRAFFVKQLKTVNCILDDIPEPTENVDRMASRIEDVLNYKIMLVPHKLKKDPSTITTLGFQELIEHFADNIERLMYEKSPVYFLYDFVDQIAHWRNNYQSDSYDKIMKAQRDARKQTPFGIYWNVTRVLSPDATKWARMLMNDKIYGVIDNGSGIIHPAEKNQAVFFSKEPLQLLATVNNPRNKEFEKEMEKDLDKPLTPAQQAKKDAMINQIMKAKFG